MTQGADKPAAAARDWAPGAVAERWPCGERTTLAAAFDAGAIRAGDIVLYDRSEAAVGPVWRVLRWVIRRSQERMLADLDHDVVDRQTRRWGARHTHAALVVDRRHVAEMDMTARLTEWRDIEPGTRLLVRRPLTPPAAGRLRGAPADEVAGLLAAMAAIRDGGLRYPVRELLYYYLWSWGFQKLTLGRKFKRVFRSGRSDTCAARTVTWWRAEAMPGAFGGEIPEAWYPGRMAVSHDWLETVCRVQMRRAEDGRPKAEQTGKGATMSIFDKVRTPMVALALVAVLALASGCGMLGGRDRSPLETMMRRGTVIMGGHININLPESQPVIAAGSSGTQITTQPGAGVVGEGLEGRPGAVNYMSEVTVGQDKQVDLGAIMTSLQDIARSSATTTPSQAQRQSQAQAEGTGGEVTAPKTTTVAPAVSVPVTGQGASSATATTTPAGETAGGVNQGD